jgi:hypothetical protein
VLHLEHDEHGTRLEAEVDAALEAELADADDSGVFGVDLSAPSGGP